MKKFALGMVLATSLISTAAVAGEQRPTYLAFSAPAASAPAEAAATPAAPVVRKRNELFSGVPLFVPLVGLVATLGFIAAVSTGDNGSPG